MTVLIVIVILFLVGLLVIAPISYLSVRRVQRERKKYDRGLKVVPLLIHLPPQSEDIEVGGRDVRDVTDENISKAQVMYNILASTYKKDFKTRHLGQRHLSFEIVAMRGFVYFYAAVPVSLVEIVKQAVVSAYPAAQLEEVEEHNIFNAVGKISGTTGGELSLKESFVYPIATYQDLKRDALQSMLNSLSGLGKEDGVGIQILLRPADPGWQKTSKKVAANKRKGGKEGISLAGFMKELGTAFIKSPSESKEEKKSEPLSGLEQATVDAIEDKSRYPGFEVLIRLVASSNVESRSQSILANVVAAFQLFDAPGKNGFKYKPAEDMQEFITSYIMRFFDPAAKHPGILNTVELSTIFHFPDQSSIPTSQLSRQDSKQVDGPRNIPEEGLMLGYNVFRGVKKPIRVALNDRQRHIYAVGQTGTGKSTFLENLALQDMLSGGGFAFVDPHGDTVDRLLAMVPKERTEDVIYFSPAETDYPMGLNLFEFNTPDQKDFLIQEVLNMLYKLYDPQHQGIMGPRYESIFRNCALAVMADPNGGTFVDIPKLFRDPQFLRQKLQHVTDQNVLDYWLKEYPASQRSNDAGEVTAWFVSKFGAFLSNEMMRNIIGHTKSAFNLREIMDDKKILLVNLSKGRTGDLNSKLLGMIFVMKFQAAAMSRANIPENQRQDFCLYVDEFQNFSTESFATIMSEARKYHLNLIVANQFTTQLSDEIRDAVFGNMGTVVSFRVGQNDVDVLARYFQPTFDASDLLRVPNFNTITRTLIGGVPTQPFSMATLPSIGTPNSQLADALKQLSAAKYGRPRATVEKEIFERMSTKPASPAFGGQMPTNPFGASTPAGGMSSAQPMTNPAGAQPTTSAKPTSSTFLDEWLARRGSAGVNPSTGANSPNASTNTNPAPSRPLANSSPLQANPSPTTGFSSLPSQNPIPTAKVEPSGLLDDHGVSTSSSTQASPPATEPTDVSGKQATNNQHEGEIHLHHDDNKEAENAIYIDNQGELHHEASQAGKPD